MKKFLRRATVFALTLSTALTPVSVAAAGQANGTLMQNPVDADAENETENYQYHFEAEDAVMSGDVKMAATRAGYSGTGYATGFTQKDGNSWSFKAEIPKSGHYTFTVRTASDSYKENYLTINGKQAGIIYSDGDGAWHDTKIESVWLEAGTATISIGEYWGWFDLDSITIEEGSGVDDSVYSSATSDLVNPNANKRTVDIMKYLKSIYGQKTLSGQSCTLNKSTEIEAIHDLTGKYPAIRMLDFIFCDPASDYQSSEEVNIAKEWDKMGGLTTFQWHWHAPKGGASFYTKDTTFDLSKAVTDLDISQKSLEEIKALYQAGTISEECYLIVRDIDVISGYLDQLQKEDVTVLWRPLHEASGGWFWWGAAGADAYQWLYKLMFERQTYYHKLNNLIWVWNGQDQDWYPGDEYCDIAGTDIYAEKHSYSALPDQFMKTVNYSGGTKMTALSENGVMMDPDLMERDNTHWLYFAVWYGDYIIDSTGKVGNTYTESTMVNKIYNSDSVITLDELPEFTDSDPGDTPTPDPDEPDEPNDPVDVTLKLSNTGNGQASTNTITNSFQIYNAGGEDLDLSKLVLRYYYTKEGIAPESFYCDNAALRADKDPWYVPYTGQVTGEYVSFDKEEAGAGRYLEIKFNTTDKFMKGATLNIDTRTAKTDWSLYDQSDDYSYQKDGNITIYYDGQLILGTEP
ncbi:glycosyl hydrolase [Clostridium sp. Marseille-P2415]|uniref:glycosyl hydrolase n=1 Tax=Clostridium sp. Marseille-P2415 TaxID=1805471 RepID=UPI0009884010|nr:glycosyl hydrolase [Clostridium sp. Marseille-P2415]